METAESERLPRIENKGGLLFLSPLSLSSTNVSGIFSSITIASFWFIASLLSSIIKITFIAKYLRFPSFKMPSFTATLPVLAGILALVSAAEFPLTSLAATPPKMPELYVPAGPVGHRPAYTPGSVFRLTQVPSNPAATTTGTPTNPDKCSQVAARITPQLTPKPTYPPALKVMADGLGGVEHDTCSNMDFNAKFKQANPDHLNRFTQARYSTFIVPIWAKVHQLFVACGDEVRKMESVAKDPCYRWALELSQSSNASATERKNGENGFVGGGDKGKNGKQGSGQNGNVKTPELEAGAAKDGFSRAVVVGVLGVMLMWWGVVA